MGRQRIGRTDYGAPVPSYSRYVALGDSQTEGLNDRDDAGRLLGWADRFARRLAATTSPGLRYANLAVRGCRARHVRQEQLPAALALAPDLATVVVGMNDVLRHDFDLDRTVDDVEATIAALRDTGCTVATMTFPDIARMLPVMGWLRPREVRLNERIVDLAARYDLPLLDVFPLEMCGDPRMWSHDRIHGSSDGHRRIAEGMAELFGLPGSDSTWASPPTAPAGGLIGAADTIRRDAWWATTFMVPWLARQVLRRGAGTLEAKRPDLTAVD
jgi:lysophospholipase L1-like esterase